MIKIRLPPTDLSSITFYQSALLLLRRVAELPIIQQKVGKISPGELLTCMTMAYQEKLAALNDRYSQPVKVEKEAPEKQGRYLKLNMDNFLDMLMASQAIFELAIISKPNLYVTSLRQLLADNDPDYARLASLTKLTVDDIAKQYKKLLNAKSRDRS